VADRAGTRVVSIIGPARAGSTIVGNLLGQLPATTFIGESDLLWGFPGQATERVWGSARGLRCGCGEALTSCPMWTEALSALQDQLCVPSGQTVGDHLSALRRSLYTDPVRTWFGPGRHRTALERYSAAMSTLYAEVGRITESSTIIDSSKHRSHGTVIRLIDEVPGASVSVVHLVRDPRSTAYSWQHSTHRDDEGKATMPSFTPVHSALRWQLSNWQAEILGRRWPAGRFVKVRYEDLTARPATALDAVTAQLGLAGSIEFTGTTANIRPTHSVGGNPSRFASGQVVITVDDRPMSESLRRDALVAWVGTLPLSSLYGYDLRWRRSSDGADSR